MSNKLNLIQLNPGAEELPALILLHGFTGRASDWLETAEKLTDICRPVLADLPGCGESFMPQDEFFYTAEGLSKILLEMTEAVPGRKVIGGYSMGSRAALLTYFKSPGQFSGLILISGTAGISDPRERELRAKADELLAAELLQQGTNDFIADWMENPLFSGLKNLPAEKYNKIITEKKLNSHEVLAYWLKHFSPGLMPDMWPLLKEIQVPVLAAYGSDDHKYQQISRRMAEEIKRAEITEIKGAGHNIHQEKPVELAGVIKAFISKNIK